MVLITEWPSGFLVGSKQRKQKTSLLCGWSQCWRQCTLCFLSLAIWWRPWPQNKHVHENTQGVSFCTCNIIFYESWEKSSKNVLFLHLMDRTQGNAFIFWEILAKIWPVNILGHAFIFWESLAKKWPCHTLGSVFIFWHIRSCVHFLGDFGENLTLSYIT